MIEKKDGWLVAGGCLGWLLSLAIYLGFIALVVWIVATIIVNVVQ